MMLCIITTSGNGKERSYMYELKAKCVSEPLVIKYLETDGLLC